tara:strand:+ start:13011 stop:13850 length:840 start_codon:yes stop_codon:yes gene_type:complete
METLFKVLFGSKKKLLAIIILIAAVQLLTSSYYVNLFGWNLYSVERVFQKGNKTITLLGTVHIADKEYYDEISNRYKNSLFLLEMVEKDVEMDVPMTYKGLSEYVDLSAQEMHFDPNRDGNKFIVADKKMSELNNLSIKTLKDVFTYIDLIPKGELSKMDLEDISFIDKMKNMKRDIIDGRSVRLMEHIYEFEGQENLVVPWGALHLPYVQDKIKELGYIKVKESRLKAFNVVKYLYTFLTKYYGGGNILLIILAFVSISWLISNRQKIFRNKKDLNLA